ncbi:MAG: hypothetical protein MJ101_05345 [Clostridia bacterium]|nr:hypothetical protein [Clostridia bacterium]
MAENYEDWGEYYKKQEWENRSRTRKVFSFRTLKNVLKWAGLTLVVGIYAILGYRMFTGLGVPKSYTKMVWTDEAKQAYDESGGTLTVYSQTPRNQYAYAQTAESQSDGHYSIYEMKYIPALKQVQFTLRYNNGTVKDLKTDIVSEYLSDGEIYASYVDALKSHPEAQSAVDAVDDMPFYFVLRDNNGMIYTTYQYTESHKGLYNYVRLVFDGVTLFDTEYSAPDKPYPTADRYTRYITKGNSLAELTSQDITKLYVDTYYENDVDLENGSWSLPLTVYDSTLDLTDYDYSKELPNGKTVFMTATLAAPDGD